MTSVAVVDSGWDRSVVDDRVGVGLNFVGVETQAFDSKDDHDRIGHGTACISVLLDVAPFARVCPVRVFDTTLETTPAMLLSALEAIVELRPALVNLSLGTPRTDFREALYRICRSAADDGIVVVAAGSQPGGRWPFPGSFDCVIGVLPAPHADPHQVSFVPDDEMECRASPRQVTRGRGGREVKVNGVSFATPVVTGRIARLLEITPNLGVDGVRSLLAASARGKMVTGG